MREINKFHRIKIGNMETGHTETLTLPQIGSVILIPKKKLATCFNVAPSSLDKWIAEGWLGRYHANGQPKYDAGRTATYIDLAAFMRLDFNQTPTKKRHPKITLRVPANHATAMRRELQTK